MNKVAKFFRETMLARFLFPVGIILLIVGIVFSFHVGRQDGYVKTTSIVSKTELVEAGHYEGDTYVEATYTVWVKYTVDEVEYETEFGEFSSYKVGDKIKIVYDPADPNKIGSPGADSIVFPIVFITLGVAALAGGVFSIVKFVKKEKALKAQEESWKDGK